MANDRLFIVHVVETSTVKRRKEIWAADECEAQHLAEAQNWDDWPEEERFGETYIDWIENQ